MGRIEEAARKQRRKNFIQQAILASLAVSGAVAVTALAPALVTALGIIARQSGARFPYRARTAAGRLAQKGDVKFFEREGKKYVELTDKGRRSLGLEMSKAEARSRQKRRWDKRYRLIIFDIPEKRRHVRRRLGAMMRECGFLRIQDSVWLFPYDCEELVTLIKAELRIGKDVLYAVVESIENDRWVREHFKLQ